METFINTSRALEEKIKQGYALLDVKLKHDTWRNWSVPAKALLTLTLGRHHDDREAFDDLAEEVDKIHKQRQLSGKEKSKLRQQHLPSLIAILEKVLARARGNKVFVVHGHNEVYPDRVARLLEQAGLSPVILREELAVGRTIIEKFEAHSDTTYAVVLLTGDDRGGSVTSPQEDLQPRARQNVILELGFFAGRLGRDRVCLLWEKGVERPSDYDGVEFVPLDGAGVWRHQLAKELAKAGFEINLAAIK